MHLTLEGVSKRFGRRRVLDQIAAEVDHGQVLVITGPNGAGKSTLLMIIAGLIRPNRGRVIASQDGKVLAPELRRSWLGLVSPDLTLYSELTALENLRFFEQVRGRDPDEAQLASLLERVGLGGRGCDRVGTFSSGMRQRLKYAFALVHAPRVLLLDEPTANLDRSGASMVAGVVAEQRARGVLVLATNQPEEVQYGDQCLALDH